MKRPTRVKVGAHTYTIHYIQPKTSHVAACYCAAKRIEVNTDLRGRFLAETLIHETMHAIWYEWGIRNSEMSASAYAVGLTTEECAVNGLCNGLAAVLRDNPAFRKFVIGGLK
jgi:hypothetical protein